MIKRIGVLIVMLVISCGCTKVKHLPQLLTLKAYSGEQESIENYVHTQDDLFAQMLADINSGDIKLFTTKEEFLGRYGDPIYEKEEQHDGVFVRKLLYRNQKEFFGSEKVYLYFDEQGRLLNLEYIPGKKEGE